MKRKFLCALFLLSSIGPAAGTVEIKGKVTNNFTEQQHRAVAVIITDRLGTEIGRTHPDKNGQYEIKISGPRYVIIKAVLEGQTTVRYQLDTQEQKESTTDLEHNRVFGELRIPTYYQDITFGAGGNVLDTGAALTLEDVLVQEDPEAVKDYQKVRRQRESRDPKKAASELEKLVKKYPNFYIGYIDLGMILAGQQNNDRAQEVFTQAQKLRPKHSWAYVGLGVVLNNKKEYQNAAQHLEKAVSIEPGSVNAQFQLGYAVFNLGDYDRALNCFERVVELDPKFNPMVYKYLSSINIKKLDSEGASAALESYLTQFPNATDRDKVEQIVKKLKR